MALPITGEEGGALYPQLTRWFSALVVHGYRWLEWRLLCLGVMCNLGGLLGKAHSESGLTEMPLASLGANVSPGPLALPWAQYVTYPRALSPSPPILLDAREIQQQTLTPDLGKG